MTGRYQDCQDSCLERDFIPKKRGLQEDDAREVTEHFSDIEMVSGSPLLRIYFYPRGSGKTPHRMDFI